MTSSWSGIGYIQRMIEAISGFNKVTFKLLKDNPAKPYNHVSLTIWFSFFFKFRFFFSIVPLSTPPISNFTSLLSWIHSASVSYQKRTDLQEKMAKYDRTNYNHARQKPLLQFLKDNLIGGNNSHG